ncbi:MAG: heat-inducible transcription repressor HrcA [Caedimonadaceae bacterium]|nr:MAG: heat-inducible transcription repressor HrcA [Caedimonadaceae bacterium]
MTYELNNRSVQIFREIVMAYCESGEPVGSQTLSERLNSPLSTATIRNVMAHLEALGLLYAPHTSAGRLPTEAGLRLFVDRLLEVQSLEDTDKVYLDSLCSLKGYNFEELLEKTGSALSGLSKCASLIFVPKSESPLKHIEFVRLDPTQTLVIIVTEDGRVENRLLQSSSDISTSILIEASNYLNATYSGLTLSEVKASLIKELKHQRTAFTLLMSHMIEALNPEQKSTLIIKGQSHLLGDLGQINDLEKLRILFEELEAKENLIQLLDASIQAEGIQIFIGSNNPIASLTETSMIITPCKNQDHRVIGALGVIGPRHLNYSRVISLVDQTARLVEQFMI